MIEKITLILITIFVFIVTLDRTLAVPEGEGHGNVSECEKFWLRDEDDIRDHKEILHLPASINLLSLWFGVEWNEDYTLNKRSAWYAIFKEIKEFSGLEKCCGGTEFLCGQSSVSGGGEILWDFNKFKLLGRVIGALKNFAKEVPGGNFNVESNVDGIWSIEGTHTQDVLISQCAKTENGEAYAYISFTATGALDLSLLDLADSSCSFGFDAHGSANWVPTSLDGVKFNPDSFRGECSGFIYAKLSLLGAVDFVLDERVSTNNQ